MKELYKPSDLSIVNRFRYTRSKKKFGDDFHFSSTSVNNDDSGTYSELMTLLSEGTSLNGQFASWGRMTQLPSGHDYLVHLGGICNCHGAKIKLKTMELKLADDHPLVKLINK